MTCAHAWKSTVAATRRRRCTRCGVFGRLRGFGHGFRVEAIVCKCGAPAKTVDGLGGYYCSGCAPRPPGRLRTLRGGDFSKREVAELQRLYGGREA